MPDDRARLRGAYARILGIWESIPSDNRNMPDQIARDYDSIVNELHQITGDDFSFFKLPPNAYFRTGGNSPYCEVAILRPRISQLKNYMQQVYHVHEEIIEIGSLYNSIQDSELKARCADLLSAPSNFDRVINQATQVLEDRLRTRSRQDGSLTGTQLVNRVLRTNLSETVLKVSNDEGEHEGFCHICRGIMGAFRNPTHHYITNKFSREDALKVCAFIDNLLRVIDEAEVINS